MNLFAFICFQLAQSNETIEQADKAIDTFDKLGKAGPVTLSIVIAFAAVVFAIIMMKKNWAIQKDRLEDQSDHAVELRLRETTAKEEADKRLKEVLSAAEERRDAEKQLMREMINSGHDSTQALETSNRAIENNTRAIETLIRRLEEMDRRLSELQRDLVDRRAQ